MKITLRLFLFASLCMALAGCPYDARVGLNTYEQSLQVNKQFFGDYTAVREDGSKDLIQITKGMKQVYNIRHHTVDETGREMEYNYYRCFITEIKGKQVVNVEKKDGKFNFYRIEWIGDDELVLYAVGEEYVKANYPKAENDDRESLRAFIEKNIDEPGLLEEGISFVRDGSGSKK